MGCKRSPKEEPPFRTMDEKRNLEWTSRLAFAGFKRCSGQSQAADSGLLTCFLKGSITPTWATETKRLLPTSWGHSDKLVLVLEMRGLLPSLFESP